MRRTAQGTGVTLGEFGALNLKPHHKVQGGELPFKRRDGRLHGFKCFFRCRDARAGLSKKSGFFLLFLLKTRLRFPAFTVGGEKFRKAL